MQIQIATKADKSAIKRFYKNNRYSASFMGDDQCFYISNNEEIIACVIVSYTTTTPFLHALVVNKHFQHKGLARQLIFNCQQLFNNIICFADIKLAEFYQKQGFVLTNVDVLTTNLQPRFYAYFRNNNNLQCYQYHAP